jgi:hypothetical protein
LFSVLLSGDSIEEYLEMNILKNRAHRNQLAIDNCNRQLNLECLSSVQTSLLNLFPYFRQ